MAPAKKRVTKALPKPTAKSKKVDAFLKDFDREVEARVERMKVTCESIQKEISNRVNIELLRMPVALREMNWMSYYAVGGSEKALEKVASAELDILEITRLASKAIQTPLKSVKKAKKSKRPIETINEATGLPVLPARKRSRQGEGAAGAPGAGAEAEAPPQKPGKAQSSVRRAPASKRSCPPSSRSSRFQKRSHKVNLVTPASQGVGARATSPAEASARKFDASIFKTPGLRAPASHEQVFSVSAKGSPLADSADVFLTLPTGGGESVRIRASELCKKDLVGLNATALGSVKKLSTQLAELCHTLSHK